MPAQLPAIGEEVAAPAALPPIGAEVSQGAPATFTVQNAKDAQGNAEVDPNTLGTFVKHLWDGVNPVQLGQLLPWPKALGGSGTDNPLNPKKVVNDLYAVKQDADARLKKGDYVGALSKYVESVVPILGPMMSHQGDLWEQGKYAAAAGDTAALAVQTAAAPAISGALEARYPLASHPAATAPPLPNAAVQFAKARNIPLDAATVSDEPVVKGVQALADRTLGGATVALPAREAQTAAMQRVAGELADDAHPVATTPESSGTAVKDAMHSLMQSLNGQATDAYERLREIEADPKHSSLVQSAPEGSAAQRSILGKLAAGHESGMAPTNAELLGMRQIEAEIDAQPFSRGKLVDFGDDHSSDSRFVRGSANASVVNDVQQAAGSHLTGQEVLQGIRRTLETGDWNQASRGALEVAKERLRTGSTSGPMLPSNTPLVGTLDRVALPVDLTQVKKVLQPLYDRLMREREITPLMGDKGQATAALDRLMNGPDRQSVSIVDAALGDLKGFARTDIPELRSQGKGAVAFAVKQLDRAVKQAALRAGPDALNALEEGRSATVAKYQMGDVLKDVAGKNADAEPVAVFKKLTGPKDSSIQLLRRVADAAPAQMPELARAYLEDLLEKPNKVSEWRKLGAETKKILFPRAGQAEALDHFFNLTDRISKTNVNPSGSGYFAWLGAQAIQIGSSPLTGVPLQIGAATVAKLLRSPAAINALTTGMKIPNTASAALKTAATLNLVRAAKSAGVTLDFPKAADQESPR